MKLIQNKELLGSLNKYMFSAANMKRGYEVLAVAAAPANIHAPTADFARYVPPAAALAVPAALAAPKVYEPKPFVPLQRDKLFWCFYIILHGYEEYEMNRSNSFSIEKRIKIETVEGLKGVKDKLKELKLKRTELEDELVHKPTITVKGLCALCLVHNVSITYVYGRKYCEIPHILQTSVVAQTLVVAQGLIIQNEKKEDALKWTTNEMQANTNSDFLTHIRATYWFIENIQKPLNAPSAYTLTELQEICQKLQIETQVAMNEKMKAKTKTKLYEEIVQTIK